MPVNIVVHQSPLPVNITSAKATVSVRVTNVPTPNMGAEEAALKISVAAVIIAAVTLGAVLWQIRLAHKELAAVNADLKNNQQQMKEFLRRPNLHAAASVSVAQNPDGRYLNLTVKAFNDGDRASPLHLFEVLVPQQYSHRANHAPNDPGLRTVNGVVYSVEYHSSLKHPMGAVYPNKHPMVYTVAVFVTFEATDLTLLWRIYDDYGKYPADNYGTFRVTTLHQESEAVSDDEPTPETLDL